MEKLQNHSGRDSVRVLRPADVNETTVCWKMAMENMDTPTALIFSRQNVANLPEGTDYSGAERGAYTVVSDAQPEVVLVASGSEVSTLVAARQLLTADGITSRVVSVRPNNWFRAQDEAYRESVIPRNAKKFFLTAGLPVVFEGLAGDTGRIFRTQPLRPQRTFQSARREIRIHSRSRLQRNQTISRSLRPSEKKVRECSRSKA